MNKRKGFTLLELIIVIIVIGILAAIAMPQFTKIVERGHIGRAKADINAIMKAEGIYYALYSTYNSSEAALGSEVPEVATLDQTEFTYVITATTGDFQILATRQRGQYADNTITYNSLDGRWYMSTNYPF